MATCPFHGDHGDREIVVFQWENGALGFKCFHARCADFKWKELRDKLGDPLREHYDAAPGQLPELTNFIRLGSDGKKAQLRGANIQVIAEQLFAITSGWPKRVGDCLFAVEADGRIIWIDGTNATDKFFAWLGTKCRMCWTSGADRVSRSQLYAYLQLHADDYDAVESLPH